MFENKEYNFAILLSLGIPQGSAFNPLLLILFTNDVSKILESIFMF